MKMTARNPFVHRELHSIEHLHLGALRMTAGLVS